MASYFHPLIVLFALVSVGLTANTSRQKRQAFGNCPQENGQFEFPGDCSKYYQCDGGQATVTDCPSQLIFNPQQGFCDWPHRVPNPSCAQSPLAGNTQGICDSDPYNGEPQNAFNVRHPDLCNAFYTCSMAYLYAPCTFCPEGSYFDEAAGGCRDYLALGLDINSLCNGRQFVDHAEKVFRQIDGSCWPFADRPNPHQEIANLLASGGGQGAFSGGFRG